MVLAVLDAVSAAPTGVFGARMDAVRTTFDRVYAAEATKLHLTIPLALLGLALLVAAPVASAAFGQPVDVRILVPAGFGLLLMVRYALTLRAVLVDTRREFRRAFPALVGNEGL